jgi:hypothetical protein
VIEGQWQEHVYTKRWTHPDAKVELADINGNGRLDIVLTPAELAGQTYKIAWYEAPADPRAEWTEHVVVDKIEAVVHALALGDFNRNGRVDIAYAQMHQGTDPDEVVIMLNRGAGKAWHKQVLSTRGSHDILAVDIDGDGNLDLIGANHGGPYQALELYRIGKSRRWRWITSRSWLAEATRRSCRRKPKSTASWARRSKPVCGRTRR